MFKFQTNIIKRRRISKSSLFLGLFAAALLGYTVLTFLEQGRVPIFEDIARQIGFFDYIQWMYIGLNSLLVLLILPALYTIFKKKVVVGGKISFDEKNLIINDRGAKFIIPEEKIPQINFELKALPDPESKNKDKLFGGSWMKIPTSKGIQRFELQLSNEREKENLLEMIEFLKIEHDVKVKIKEIK